MYSFWYSVGSTGCRAKNDINAHPTQNTFRHRVFAERRVTQAKFTQSQLPCPTRACRIQFFCVASSRVQYLSWTRPHDEYKRRQSTQLAMCGQFVPDESRAKSATYTHLGNVVGHGRVVEVIVDVVVHAVGHALEEIGHVRVPGRLPGPGSVVERVHLQDFHEHLPSQDGCQQGRSTTPPCPAYSIYSTLDHSGTADGTMCWSDRSQRSPRMPPILEHSSSSFSFADNALLSHTGPSMILSSTTDGDSGTTTAS